MKVLWTRTAEDNLDSIFSYISQSSPLYARRIVDKITRRSIQISEYPLAGRIVPEISLPQVREIFEGNYRIIYVVRTAQVEVLAVIHSFQLLSPKKRCPRPL